MLLRIEPVSSLQNSQSQLPSQSPAVFEPLHINLNTSSHHRGGILLHVGRKASDLPYQSEKSVSRSHCRLRLVSLDQSEEAQDENDTEHNTPIYPRTAEEKKACENSVDNLAIAIEDLGSKFGTKVTYTLNPKISSTLAPSLSPSECETEDEETDDEDQNHTSTDPSVSSINYIVKNLEKNGSIVIPTLSLPPSDEHMIHETHLTADIQCGSACFRVTRVPLNFCVSRLPSSDRKEVINAAPMIGARVMSSIDLSTSHLITPNRKFVAKLVGAWVRSIPVVTPSFVLEMNKRKDPSNPLPHVKDHLAEGKTQIDSLQCTPDQPKHILSKFMVLSLIESEAVMLCKCAGATIKKLYSANGDKTFWQTDKFFEDLTSESKEKGLHLIWIDSTSDSMKKGKEYLTEKTTSDLNLSCVTQSGIIRAITNLSPLEDIEGHVLNDVQQNIVNITKGRSEDQPEDRNDDTEDEIDQKKYSIDSKQDDTAATTSKDELPDVASNSVDDQKEFDYITQVNSVEDKQTTKNATNLELSIKPNGSKAKETRSKTEQFYETQEHHHSQKVMQKQEKVKSKQKKQSSSVSSGWTQSSQKSKSSMTSSLQPEDSQSSAWMTSQRMSKSGDLSKRKQRRQEDSNSWISTNKKLKSRKNDESLDLIEEDDGNDNSDGNGAMQAQQSLPKTDDGWFVAPKGKARLQYKCDVNEILGDNEIGIVEPAQTEMCNLIVVQKQVIQPAESASNTLSKDFKRFRKNSIISGARMHSIKPVMLDVHLPKESDQQRVLEASQIQYDQEQQAAESLFADDVHSTKHGIKSFLKPTRGRSFRRRG